MSCFQQLAQQFEPISLGEMDSVKLLDRTDTKYIFNTQSLPDVMEKMMGHYRILEVHSLRMHRYESLYYDTQDYQMYLKHHAGCLNRYKIRYRKYVDTNLNYFEIKFKSNKNRTVKNRIKKQEIEFQIEGHSEEFLKGMTKYSGNNLMPQLWVNYTRVTFVNKQNQERLTFDLNLNYKKNLKTILFDTLVIAELKQEKAKQSEFKNIMKKMGVNDGKISKYCFGISLIVDDIKRNNFKQKILRINKVNSGNANNSLLKGDFSNV